MQSKADLKDGEDHNCPLSTSNPFLHQLLEGEDLVAASQTRSEAHLFLLTGLLSIFLKPGLNDLEHLANDGKETDAAIGLTVLVVTFLVNGDENVLLPS